MVLTIFVIIAFSFSDIRKNASHSNLKSYFAARPFCSDDIIVLIMPWCKLKSLMLFVSSGITSLYHSWMNNKLNVSRENLVKISNEVSLQGYFHILQQITLDKFADFKWLENLSRIYSELQSYLINYLLQRGQVPFCQAVTDNVKSLSLQQRLGMNISRDAIIWMLKKLVS